MRIQIDKKLFGMRLSESMKENNDTTYSLADYLHLSSSAISRYTSGDMAPKILILEAIANKYRINQKWLIGIEGIDKHHENCSSCGEVNNLIDIPLGKIALILCSNCRTELWSKLNEIILKTLK